MQASRRAYSYIRFSTPEQGRGATRKRQQEAASAYARENRLVLDDELRDEGVSAFRGRNRDPTSALGAFLGRVREGSVERGSVLLVESFDRLSREQVIDALELFLGLLRAGIEIVTLIDGRAYSREGVAADATQLIISIVIMSRAYEESATKGKRVGDAWRRKREAARARRQAMTARCPGWIRLVGGPRTGQYEVVEDRGQIIRQIFAETIAGDGRRTIAKRLNAAGVATWGIGRSKASRWHDSYVAKILSSPACFGRQRVDGEDVDDYFPAVIDQGTFWAAQAAAEARGCGQGRTSAQFSNLLRGLAKCKECGSPLVYIDKGKRSRPHLMCGKARASAGCGVRQAFPYWGLERLLIHAYAHFADTASFALDGRVRRADADRSAAEKRRENLVGRRDNLLDAIEQGTSPGAVKARLDALEIAISEVETEIASLRRMSASGAELLDDIEDRMLTVEAKLYAPDPAERYRGRSTVNQRLRTFLDRIELTPDGKMWFFLRPGFEDLDRDMLKAYGPESRPEN